MGNEIRVSCITLRNKDEILIPISYGRVETSHILLSRCEDEPYHIPPNKPTSISWCEYLR